MCPTLLICSVFPRNLPTSIIHHHYWSTLLQQWAPRSLLEHIAMVGTGEIVEAHCCNSGNCNHCLNTHCNSRNQGSCWFTTKTSDHMTATSPLITSVHLLFLSSKSAECCGQVVNTPALYSGSPGLKSRSRYRLSWLRFFMVFLGPSRPIGRVP
jgi:hypothetical protein